MIKYNNPFPVKYSTKKKKLFISDIVVMNLNFIWYHDKNYFLKYFLFKNLSDTSKLKQSKNK